MAFVSKLLLNIKHLYVTTQSTGCISNAPKSQQTTTTTHGTAHFTFSCKTQTNATSPKNFFEVLQLNANGIRNKTDEIQLLIKNTQADVITI